jgi:hypothetical protein
MSAWRIPSSFLAVPSLYFRSLAAAEAVVRNRSESIEVGRALPGPINSNFHQLPRGRATRPKTGQHFGDGPRIHPRLPKASQEVVKLSIRSIAKIFDFVRVVLAQKGGDFREG